MRGIKIVVVKYISMKRNIRGFTLIELVASIIIICLLIALAVPIFKGYMNRTILQEAISAMQTIYLEERLYQSKPENENGSYLEFDSSDRDDALTTLGIEPASLNGKYFSKECYEVSVKKKGDTCEVSCTPAKSTAPQKDELKKWKKFELSDTTPPY